MAPVTSNVLILGMWVMIYCSGKILKHKEVKHVKNSVDLDAEMTRFFRENEDNAGFES